MKLPFKKSALLFLFVCSVMLSNLNAQKSYAFVSKREVSGGTEVKSAFVFNQNKKEVTFTLPKFKGKISLFEADLSTVFVDGELSSSFGHYQNIRSLPTYKIEYLIPGGEEVTIEVLTKELAEGSTPFEALIEVSYAYKFKGMKAITIKVSPFKYSKARKILSFYKTLRFKLVHGTTKNRDKVELFKDFNVLAEDLFINYNDIESQLTVTDTIKLLIITPKKYKTKLNRFVDWKRKLGFEVKVAIYPSETGDIEDYMHQHSCTHLILVGAAEDIPSNRFYIKNHKWSKREESGKAFYSDAPYSGIDPLAKIFIPQRFVSRILARTPDQVEQQLNLFVDFEQGKFSKGEHTLFVASAENNGIDQTDIAVFDEIEGKLEHTKIIKVYQGMTKKSVTPETIYNALDQKVAIAFYLGHGFETHWSTSRFKGLNDCRRTLFIQPVCLTGTLSKLSLAEQQMNHNALGVFASSNNTYWPTSFSITKEIAKQLQTKKFKTIGGLLSSGVINLSLRGNSLGNPLSEAEFISNQFHYFGDCTLSPDYLYKLYE